jgi:hypothetical protein
MVLESSRRELQHWFRPRPDRRLEREAMTVQSPGSSNWDNFGTGLHFGSPETKSHSDVASTE